MRIAHPTTLLPLVVAFGLASCSDDNPTTFDSPTKTFDSPIASADSPVATFDAPPVASIDAPPAAGAPTVRILSSKPEYVSGGDALVSVEGTADTLHATLNGTDVSSAFTADPDDATRMIGLVTGMTSGANSLVVDNGGAATTLAITNWPATGPILSGPQITPFICQTSTFGMPDGTKLGDATTDMSPTCSAPTKVQWMYKKTGGTALVPLADPAHVPDDCATTNTTAGVTVNFIVRVETGTMDRGIYQNAILHDPTVDPDPTPLHPPAGWNHKLIAVHGSGCVGGWYIQGPVMGVSPYADATNFIRLGEGYAVFTNTLNHPTNSCNPIVAGEATMMGKEHFIETFGVPLVTVSTGGSGGAYTTLQVADIYPGLIDGAFISATFPESLAISTASLDDKLLYHYYEANNSTVTLDAMVKISGHEDAQAWYDLALQSGRTDPVPGRVETIPGGILGAYASAVFNAAVPAAIRYNPSTNPTGARGTVFDVAKAVYGVDAMGRGNRAYDNVGIQYGLAELNDHTITTTQFLDLNEKIGGYDSDGNYTTTRAVADDNVIKRTFQSGVTTGTMGGLASIPIFDTSALMDDSQLYHYQYNHFAVRDRLVKANGDSQNHVMWRGGTNAADVFGTPDVARAAVAAKAATDGWAAFMKWVNAVHADTSSGTQRAKVIADKPAEAVDGCFTLSTTPTFQAETQTLGHDGAAGTCNALWPSWTNPRMQAGGPISNDVLKCQRKAIAAGDYQVTFTADEMTRLQTIFPGGVCDYSKPSADKMPVVTYGSFGPSTVNPVFDVTAKR